MKNKMHFNIRIGMSLQSFVGGIVQLMQQNVYFDVLSLSRTMLNVRQADLDQLREQLEEEQESRSDLQRMLTKANNEVAVWRHKCESGEGGVRSEEMEELKRKMNAKIMELEAQLEAAQSKASSMEKVKNRLQGELEDLTIEVERVREVFSLF